MSVKIKKITMYQTTMKLRSPFITHLETVSDRESILLKVEDSDGVVGWGEVVAFSSPWYTEETIETAWHMLKDFFIPGVSDVRWTNPTDVNKCLKKWRGNNMAKAGVETAIWDLFAKKADKALATYIGGVRDNVEAGVVVSSGNPSEIVKMIDKRLDEGYRRVKVKIDPTTDISVLQQIRDLYPDLLLMVDANSAYSLNDIDHLKKLDKFGLMMIEQPLGIDDIVEHAELQKEICTPVCLDESINSLEDAKNAIKLRSCKVINIKIGRVGGLAEAIAIHNLCLENDIPVWCGGMLETGISRAFNIALSTLPNFTIPGDLSASSRYWEKDVIVPEVRVVKGKINVPTSSGIGFEVDEEFIQQICKRSLTFQ
ncbi:MULTISPECIES: o-succinylbenzoate synthase [Bacillus]|uniref:o-succinylbenzoate synthase n=1 Tax=Bacillus TaxID=1386 RepID=UPI000BB78E2F|nr:MULTISPECIES: o-succinylbenzoate synthase [Bacillus]